MGLSGVGDGGSIVRAEGIQNGFGVGLGKSGRLEFVEGAMTMT